ncbi:hypothetical protein GCM10010129_80890 [Streptomyces fumigatiscleroticus]|nr:hypothetical protein GCM10010129_80890 [Streptomyces fumigatiscleroticus]
MGPPPAVVGDAPDLLDVQMDHVARVAGHDSLRRAPVGRAVGAEEAALVDAQARRPPAYGALAVSHALAREFQGDPSSGPLVVSSQLLNPFDDIGSIPGSVKTAGRSAFPQPDFAVRAVPVLPHGQAGAGDTGSAATYAIGPLSVSLR